MKKYKGFTLVELLVVIAIIALLMSILMPALSRVRAQAKAVLCQANLKQLAICWSTYLDDNDGYFPHGWVEPFTIPCSDYWMTALRTCYKDVDVLLCPAAAKLGTETGNGPFGGAGTFVAWGEFQDQWNPPICEGLYGSIGHNAFTCNPKDEIKDIQGHPTSNNWRRNDVKGTAKIPLMCDEQWIDHWPHYTDDPPDYEGQAWGEVPENSSLRICINRHDGKINILYMDYSIKPVSLKAIWRQKWHRTYDLNYALPDWPEWMKNFPEPE